MDRHEPRHGHSGSIREAYILSSRGTVDKNRNIKTSIYELQLTQSLSITSYKSNRETETFNSKNKKQGNGKEQFADVFSN